MRTAVRATRTPGLMDPVGDEPNHSVASDPLSREVYGIMGVPIDLTTLPEVIAELRMAAEQKTCFIMSTPNLNFLVLSQHDSSFRESLLMSDLCPADGIAVVWLGRLLGVPLPARIAGSDIFEAIRLDDSTRKPMRVVLFGGADGLSQLVAQKINENSAGMKCVGAISPGFGSVATMSRPELIAEINANDADFLAVFLGAKKGQDWLFQNRDRISIPVRAHLGATINYQAGTVKRAPSLWQTLGLEWLWRIKEEPYLWQRYLLDGLALARILLVSVLPSAIHEYARWAGRRNFHISLSSQSESTYVTLRGPAVAANLDQITSCFRKAIAQQKGVLVDVSDVTRIDARFFGLLIMLRKLMRENRSKFRLICQNKSLQRIIRLRGFGYMLRDNY